MNEFYKLLKEAQNDSRQAKEKILIRYQPLLYKYAKIDGRFSEDLYQELAMVVLTCIEKFQIGRYV